MTTTDQIKSALRTQIDILQSLHDRLSDTSGDPLDAREKSALREALAGQWLKDMFREQRYFFTEGNYDDFQYSHINIQEVLKKLM